MAKFNKRAVNYVAEKKKKVRVKRKLAGTIEKHRVGVKLQSGARTKKAQRRVAHMERVDGGAKPESQAPSRRVSSDGMEVMSEAADEAQPAAAKSQKAAQLRAARKAAKAAKPVAMQE